MKLVDDQQALAIISRTILINLIKNDASLGYFLSNENAARDEKLVGDGLQHKPFKRQMIKYCLTNKHHQHKIANKNKEQNMPQNNNKIIHANTIVDNILSLFVNKLINWESAWPEIKKIMLENDLKITNLKLKSILFEDDHTFKNMAPSYQAALHTSIQYNESLLEAIYKQLYKNWTNQQTPYTFPIYAKKQEFFSHQPSFIIGSYITLSPVAEWDAILSLTAEEQASIEETFENILSTEISDDEKLTQIETFIQNNVSEPLKGFAWFKLSDLCLNHNLANKATAYFQNITPKNTTLPTKKAFRYFMGDKNNEAHKNFYKGDKLYYDPKNPRGCTYINNVNYSLSLSPNLLVNNTASNESPASDLYSQSIKIERDCEFYLQTQYEFIHHLLFGTDDMLQSIDDLNGSLDNNDQPSYLDLAIEKFQALIEFIKTHDIKTDQLDAICKTLNITLTQKFNLADNKINNTQGFAAIELFMPDGMNFKTLTNLLLKIQSLSEKQKEQKTPPPSITQFFKPKDSAFTQRKEEITKQLENQHRRHSFLKNKNFPFAI